MGVHVFPPWTPLPPPSHPMPQGHPSAPALGTLSHASNLDWKACSLFPCNMLSAVVCFNRCSLSSCGCSPVFLNSWVFTMNGCWILSGALSGSMDIIILFLFFGLIIYWTTLFGFLILNQPCPSGINPTWTQCIDFCVVGFGLLIFCWGVFTSKFRSDIGLCGALFYSVFTLCLVSVLGQY